MRTYKGRTPEEQRQFNRERRERYKQAKELQAQGIEPDASTADDFDVHIEAETVTRPVLSLKDRLLEKFKKDDEDEEKPPTKGEKEHVEKSQKLLSHILPMTLSALFALYSQKLFSENYKKCAPSKEEVATVLLPVFSIISRHVAVEGKASQDAIDMGAVLLASITVGTRMLMTAEEIRKHESTNQGDNISQFRGSEKSAYRTEGTAALRHHPGENGTGEYGRESDDGVNGHGDVGNVSATGGASDADKVAALMRRDTAGRRQMGLAPRSIREEGD